MATVLDNVALEWDGIYLAMILNINGKSLDIWGTPLTWKTKFKELVNIFVINVFKQLREDTATENYEII